MLAAESRTQPPSRYSASNCGLFQGRSADIVYPLRYAVTIEASDADKDLVKRLENGSTLKSDEERPVSGSLGRCKGAGRPRANRCAPLRRRPLRGVVTTPSRAKPRRFGRPTPNFGPQPIPVVIPWRPDRKFTLGGTRLEGDAGRARERRFRPDRRRRCRVRRRAQSRSADHKGIEAGRQAAGRITDRQIVADHATSTLDVTLTVAAGRSPAMATPRWRAPSKVDRDFTEYMTGLKRGRQYSPDEIDDAVTGCSGSKSSTA